MHRRCNALWRKQRYFSCRSMRFASDTLLSKCILISFDVLFGSRVKTSNKLSKSEEQHASVSVAVDQSISFNTNVYRCVRHVASVTHRYKATNNALKFASRDLYDASSAVHLCATFMYICIPRVPSRFTFSFIFNQNFKWRKILINSRFVISKTLESANGKKRCFECYSYDSFISKVI